MNTYCESLLKEFQEQPVTKRLKKLKDFANTAPKDTLTILLFVSLLDPSSNQGIVNITRILWDICKKRIKPYDLSLGEVLVDTPGVFQGSKEVNAWFYERLGLLDEKHFSKSAVEGCQAEILKTLMESKEAIDECSLENLMERLLVLSKRAQSQRISYAEVPETGFDTIPKNVKSFWRFFETKTSLLPFPDTFLFSVCSNDEIQPYFYGLPALLDPVSCYRIKTTLISGKKNRPTAYSLLHGRIKLIAIDFQARLFNTFRSGNPKDKHMLKRTCSRLVQLRDLPTLRFIDSFALQDYNSMCDKMDPQKNPFLAALMLEHFNVAKYMLTRSESPLQLTDELVDSVKAYIGGENPYKAVIMEKNILHFLEEAKMY